MVGDDIRPGTLYVLYCTASVFGVYGRDEKKKSTVKSASRDKLDSLRDEILVVSCQRGDLTQIFFLGVGACAVSNVSQQFYIETSSLQAPLYFSRASLWGPCDSDSDSTENLRYSTGISGR